MKETLIALRWPRIFTALVSVPILALIYLGSDVPILLSLILAFTAASILAATLRIRWGRSTRAMTDVIGDVEAEPAALARRTTAPRRR